MCFGEWLELHLRLELPYERGLLDRRARAGHGIFCFRAGAGGQPAYTPVSAFSCQEAETSSPQISAAEHDAASRGKWLLVTTLLTPKFTYQQLVWAVQKPFLGYTNSDFAYIGIGASQELPYQVQARGEVAERDADTKLAEVDHKNEYRRMIKADYLQLAYLQALGSVLHGKTSPYLTSSFRMQRPTIRSARGCSRMFFRRK